MNDRPDVLMLGFNCNCYQQIMDNGGQEMLDTLYKGLVLPAAEGLDQCNLTLKIDAGQMGKT